MEQTKEEEKIMEPAKTEEKVETVAEVKTEVKPEEKKVEVKKEIKKKEYCRFYFYLSITSKRRKLRKRMQLQKESKNYSNKQT